MATVKLTLSKEQYKAAAEHAEKKHRTVEEDVLHVWWHRVKALADYGVKVTKKGMKFRAVAPRLLPDAERERIKAEAVKKGIAVPPMVRVKKERKPKKVKEPKVKLNPEASKKFAEGMRERERHIRKVKEQTRRIDLYDAAPVAMAKAERLAEKAGKSLLEVLKENGRDAGGYLIKKAKGA